jgi:hypothetical protein
MVWTKLSLLSAVDVESELANILGKQLVEIIKGLKHENYTTKL